MSQVSYSNVVCSLIYVMVCTRLDISQVIGVASRYMAHMGKAHW